MSSMTRPLLVTAGATRNPVDAIRYLSAHASGRTGVELVGRLARAAGADRREATFLGSAEACLRARLDLPPGAATVEEYGSTRDLEARVQRWAQARPGAVIVHSAAVGDYEVAADALAAASKIPSGQAELVLRLTPTPKILDQVRGWCPDARLVSFKAGRPGLTAEELEAIARAQLRRTGCDLVFANVIGALATSVLLVTEGGCEAFPERAAAVAALAERVVRFG